MARAVHLAARANHSTSPNPMVGAVVVQGDEVVGEGLHRRAGGPHAEVAALRAAGGKARGATLYVTLEPCSHHGRTGPCVDAVTRAGISRVVIAQRDPSPGVGGAGVRRLRAAGIEVSVGDGRAAARGLNPAWLRAQQAGRPFVALKYAATLDGKTASRTGDSQWITGGAARLETHRLRSAYSAVMVGAQTVLLDDPRLNARDGTGAPSGRQPLRVVVDGRLRTDPRARVHAVAGGGSLVMASRRASVARLAGFRAAGVDVEVVDADEPSGSQLLAALRRRGVSSVLAEGGGELAWSLAGEGLVDHVYAFTGPILLGGRTAPTPVGGEGYERLVGGLRLEIVSVRRLGPDLLVEAVAA
ncbi:MAG: bifunctional diaminohydroxyphosphoribosylaminopyrimidine deaminase/5-amino-6-(5-phosphoribosylamino)uracil reductase RibD [Candidatus Dormibacteria bacterium]